MIQRDVSVSRAENTSVRSGTGRRPTLTIKQYNIGLGVHGPRKRNSGLLPTAQSHTPLSDLGLVSVVEKLEVRLQTAVHKNLVIPIRVEDFAKEDVFLDSLGHAPAFLGGIANSAFARKVEEGIFLLKEMKFSK